MSKPEQILIIEPPNELKFKGPFNVPVTSYMKLTNPSEKKVLFKIKTTAPKKYCVRPNSGMLEAGANIEIAISLQPVEFASTEKNKHKFMVQSLYAPEGQFQIEQIWKDTTPEELMDSKLRCVFETSTEKNEESEEPADAAYKTGLPANKEHEQPEQSDELLQLKESERFLRQENLRLKEDLLQFRQSYARPAATQNKYTPPTAPQENMAVLIIGAVVLGILGMILGKFVL